MLPSERCRDCLGQLIRNGAIIQHGNKRGIVLEDEFIGQYAILENGMKLRIADYCKKLKVIKKAPQRRQTQVMHIEKYSFQV